MRYKPFSSVRCLGVGFLALSLLFSAAISAQQPPAKDANSDTANSTAAASSTSGQSPRPPLRKADAVGSEDDDKKTADLLIQRYNWFNRPRASVRGRIPGGAYQRGFQHLQQMLQAEGKLVRLPDGSFAEAPAPLAQTSLAAITSAWTSLGPAPAMGGTFSPVTGRVMTIAVDPSDTTGNTVLLGGAMGGIWRSTDAGATWTAVGDQNASLAMGAIAFAPSSPATVYAGTGELSLGFDTYYGAGVLKSTNHGQTWTQTCTVPSSTCPFIGPYVDQLGSGFGFLNFGGAHISYLAVNPTNPNMILAGVQIIVEGPKEGVYCSQDGGTTWTNVLPDQEATFVGFANATVAYAALGNMFGSSTGAPNGNGIYKATTIGTTCSSVHFTRLTSGLPPQSSMGRIDLGIAPSDSTGNTVYASIADASNGSATNLGVYLTTNGGTSWTRTTAPDVCQHQCWYDNVVKVDPTQTGTAFFAGSAVRDGSGNPSWVVRTSNSGTTWSSVIPNLSPGSAALPHVDSHAIALFRTNSGKVRMYLGNDGGVWRTDDAEAASVQWINLNNPSLSITQFYPTVSVPVTNPAAAFGGTQDNGSLIYQGGVSWVDNKQCGDGGSTAVDYQIPSTIYMGCVTGAPVNVSFQNGTLGTFSEASDGINPSDVSSFVPPLTTDPNTANVLYFGTTKVYQSLDAGTTWTVMSPDLVGGGNWLTALTVAPGNPNILYVGSSSNQGFTFSNVSVTNTNFIGASPWNQNGIPPRQINAIGVDPSDATGMTAYAAFSGFAFVGNDPFGNPVNDPLGHIFKTTNGGQTWSDVSCSVANCSKPALTDLPNVPVNDVLVDPNLPNILYAATDLGVFIGDCTVSPCSWSTVGTGLPRVAVLSLRLNQASRTLLAGTHGRGAWTIVLNNFTFSGPHVSSISPVSANAGGATFTLAVNGSGLTGGAVQWNGSSTGVTMLAGGSDTQLTATIATSLLTIAGVPKITVQVGSQVSNSLPFSVLAATPTLTSVTPSSTPVQTPNPSTNISVKFIGTGFSSLAKILWNGAPSGATIAAPTASCPLPTCLTASLPASLLGPFGGTNDISVLNTPPGGGKSNSLTFKVAAPPPPNDNFANAINITQLTFNDTQDSSGATTESSDPVPPCVTQFTAAQGNTGGHPNGAYNTIWYKFTPQFSANLSLDTFYGVSSYDTVLSVWTGSASSLTNVACNDDINPGVITQSQLPNVGLTAATTYYIMVSSFGPPDPNPIALGGRSQFNFSYNNGFNPTPSITSVSPASANSGDPTFTLTVNGSGFLNGATLSLMDSLNASTSLPTTFVSSTQVTAVVPSSAILFPGTYELLAFNPPPSGESSFVYTINVGTYPIPTLDSISPTNIIAGTIFPVTIRAVGTNFALNGNLSFNGTAQQTQVFLHTISEETVPASAFATPGNAQVVFSNPVPGGGPSNPLTFTIAAPTAVPTITSLNPSSGQPGASLTMTVTGTNFLSGAEVCLGFASGISCNSTTFVSSTQLSSSFFLPPNLGSGNIPLYVVDPSPAGTSAPFNFTVTAPPPPPDFSITSSGTTSQTVNAGATATYTNVLTVSPQNGFANTIGLTCSVPANLTICSVNPPTLTSGSATVTVTTTARGLMPPTLRPPRPYWPVPIYFLLIAAMFAAIFFALRSRRFRLAFAIPAAAIALFLVLHAAGCGGGSSTPPPPPPPTGTRAGSYTITVTATSGTLTHTTTLTLVVN